MKIHKEGIRTLIIVFLCLLAGNITVFMFLDLSRLLSVFIPFCSSIILIYFLQFFRNPTRQIVVNNSKILAPADGKLVVVEETKETEYFNDQRLQVSIFMSPYNVHSNRSPVSGEVTYIKYHPGKFYVAWHPKSSILNERSTIVVRMDSGEEIMIRQVAGAVARRIVTYPGVGDRIMQGEEIGFIKFGSRVDLFLPPQTDISLNIGQKVKSGVSSLTP